MPGESAATTRVRGDLVAGRRLWQPDRNKVDTGGRARLEDVIATAPAPDTPVPVPISRIAGERPIRRVWRNELDGVTFEIGADPHRVFAKWQPHSPLVDLAREADRLTWAAAHLRVPTVLQCGADDDGQWLVTAAVPGRSAVDPRWLAEPARAVAAIGHGLRALHDTLPVAECPYDWSVQRRLASLEREGLREVADWDPLHQHLDPTRAMDLFRVPPSIDRLVVCHGDACAPNTLLTDDGRWSGHVDFGQLGLADRWADLAIAAWSTEWNYGPGWADALLEAYGVEPDEQRSAYYRLLWDVAL
jgi:kanamycin kinase